jgi:hypothetical protein
MASIWCINFFLLNDDSKSSLNNNESFYGMEKEEHVVAQGATTIISTWKFLTYIEFEEVDVKHLVDPYVGVRPNYQTCNYWQECKQLQVYSRSSLNSFKEILNSCLN